MPVESVQTVWQSCGWFLVTKYKFLDRLCECNTQNRSLLALCCCQNQPGSVKKLSLRCAGLVSLTLLDKPVFGPPHLHMQQPTRCHFIGDLSPQGNPLHYLASVRSLYDWYLNQSGRKEQGNTVRPPLVVNTHGWIKVHNLIARLPASCVPFISYCIMLCCAVLC